MSPTLTLPKRSTATSATPNASTTSEPTINAFSSTNGSLSIGAKAGIALAALIVTALILVGILFLMKRKKQARKVSMAASTTAAADPSRAPLARNDSCESALSEAEEMEKRGGHHAVRAVRNGV